jgi:site-specific DNA recombinase
VPASLLARADNVADRERVDGLHQALAIGAEQDQAQDAMRGLIDKVVLTPVDGMLRVDLHGEVAAILQLSVAGKKGRLELDADGKQLVMVAGVGFEPTTLRL